MQWLFEKESYKPEETLLRFLKKSTFNPFLVKDEKKIS